MLYSLFFIISTIVLSVEIIPLDTNPIFFIVSSALSAIIPLFLGTSNPFNANNAD